MLRFMKITIAGGLLFIMPLMLIFILIEKALHLLRGAAVSAFPHVSTYSVSGVTLLSLSVGILLVVICFLAGLLAKTRPATEFVKVLEGKVLGNLPGYELLKDATARLAGVEIEESAKVGLICEEDCWRFCLVVEERSQSWVSVYIPDAGPAGATGGELRVMPTHLVRMTGLGWVSVLACLRRGGHGALALAIPWLPKQ